MCASPGRCPSSLRHPSLNLPRRVIRPGAGADGLDGDPLSTLTYTIEGLEYAVRYVRRGFRDVPMLIGGAGALCPMTSR